MADPNRRGNYRTFWNVFTKIPLCTCVLWRHTNSIPHGYFHVLGYIVFFPEYLHHDGAIVVDKTSAFEPFFFIRALLAQ